MQKLKKLSEIIAISQISHPKHLRVGLITGCFDILHAGHIGLFQFAKKNCDVLIIGLENDQTIKLSKGPDRPINNFLNRAIVLSEMHSIDYIFKIPITVKFANSETIKNEYVKMTMKIKPDYLFTTNSKDKYIKNKKLGLSQVGIKFMVYKTRNSISTSSIVKKIKQV